MIREKQIEENFINKLIGLKYTYRPDICDRDVPWNVTSERSLSI